MKFKVYCEYYLEFDDIEQAEDFVIDELADAEFFNRHLIIEEIDDKEKVDIFNEDDNECPVCKYGWEGYRGNYDELCDKHYLEAEPS